ncbi:hypothetical protein [Paraburkholderia sp. SIMBA_030]|uniref:hypothetical protein n=1 Tax=Paraburkholderia sp. SIMBA_030 TaxID=3085773 RepID=UPI0039791B13
MQSPIATVAQGVPDDGDVIREGFELMLAFGPFHEMVGPTWYRRSERGVSRRHRPSFR